jgi:hypothetical protein
MKESADLVIGRSGDRKSNRTMHNAWSILRAVLHEIFDESAYDRFLHRTHSSRTRESYRAFLQEHESATARKPRCC